MTLQESLSALHPVALLSPRLWQREGTQIQSWCHSQRGRTLPRVHETLLALLMHYPCASPGGDFPKESVNGRAARAGTNHCCLFFFFFFFSKQNPRGSAQFHAPRGVWGGRSMEMHFAPHFFQSPETPNPHENLTNDAWGTILQEAVLLQRPQVSRHHTGNQQKTASETAWQHRNQLIFLSCSSLKHNSSTQLEF